MVKHIVSKKNYHTFLKWWELGVARYYRIFRPVRWYNLRNLIPFSRTFGLERGLAIDRYYIEKFLEYHQKCIFGQVLEIGDPRYTHKFGKDRVNHANVLHTVANNPHATIIGDLATGENLPLNAFDCIILIQTLPFIYDVQAALTTCYAMLKPNGTLLVTVPGISQISRYDMDRWGDFWRFTSLSAKKLFTEIFPEDSVTVNTYGNVLTATAFLQGLASEELSQEELDYQDVDYQVLISIKAKRPKDAR